MHSEMRERIASENIENKEKIITDAEEARRQFRGFWKTDNDPEVVRKEIEQIEKRENEEIIKHGDEQLAWLLQSRHTAGRKRRKDYDPNKLVFVSESGEKRSELSGIVKDLGYSLSDQKIGDANEAEAHEGIKELISEDAGRNAEEKRGYEPYWYSLDIAKAKMDHARGRSVNNPMITSDIVVLKGEGAEIGDILEKAESKEDAIRIIEGLSGKQVNVSCGIALMTETRSAEKFLLKGGINFTIKLRNFSGEEAREYVERQKDSVLKVAGVIDYSSNEAKKMIDNDAPIKVEALKLQGHDWETVSISSEILPQLKDYFKGVPKELIGEMLSRQKVLSEI